MQGTGDSLSLEIEDGVARLTFRRGHAANSFDQAFWRDLPERLTQVSDDPSVRVLIIAGEGKHFSAGMDLDYFASAQAREGWETGRYREWLRRLILSLQRPITMLEALGVPVIAAVQGACLGAGLDLICACDLRYATADAFFAIHETNIGMTADLGVLQRLPGLIGPQLARELAYTGDRLPAEQASRAGLIGTPLADLEALNAHVEAVARRIATKSPLAVTGAKVALTAADRERLAPGLAHMASWNAAMWVSEDLGLGMAAQKAGRAPAYADLLGPAPG